jgi:hypothetical protein
MLKTTTIISNGKLLGYIRLQEDVLINLKPDMALLLEQEINKGDSTILTFRLTFVKATLT